MWAWAILVALVIGVAASSAGSNGDAEDAPETAPETSEVDPESTATDPASTSVTSEPPATADTTDTTDTTDTVETTEPVEATDPTTTQAPAATSDEVAGSPSGLTGSRQDPVPVGQIADIGEGWRLQVLDVVLDGAAAVAAENQFNDPPPPGSTFTLVTVALGYFGLDDPKIGLETTISAVGADNRELDSDCGVVPSSLDLFADLFSGAVAVGNLCFVTTAENAATLQLYASGGLFGGDDVFLDASSPPAGAVAIASLSGPQQGAASTPSRLSPTPIATAVDVGEGWVFTVTGPARDVTDTVLAENSFNEPPPDGSRFVGVDVSYTYNGAGAGQAFAVTMYAVGNSNRQLPADCGVTPGEVDGFVDIFSGGSVSGMVCFVVPITDMPAIVLYGTADVLGEPDWFATA